MRSGRILTGQAAKKPLRKESSSSDEHKGLTLEEALKGKKAEPKQEEQKHETKPKFNALAANLNAAFGRGP